MCEMKAGKTKTDGDKCDKCEGEGQLAGTQQVTHQLAGVASFMIKKNKKQINRFHDCAENKWTT